MSEAFRHFSANNLASYIEFINLVRAAWYYLGQITSFERQIELEQNPLYVGLRSAITVLGQPRINDQLRRALEQGWTIHLYVGDWSAICTEFVPDLAKPAQEIVRAKGSSVGELPTWCIICVPPPHTEINYAVQLNDSWFPGLIFNGLQAEWPGNTHLHSFWSDLRLACDLITHGSHQAIWEAQAKDRPPVPELPHQVYVGHMGGGSGYGH